MQDANFDYVAINKRGSQSDCSPFPFKCKTKTAINFNITDRACVLPFVITMLSIVLNFAS